MIETQSLATCRPHGVRLDSTTNSRVHSVCIVGLEMVMLDDLHKYVIIQISNYALA